MAKVCEFLVGPDQIEFRTQKNGDKVRIAGVKLTAENAANLAWLVNGSNHLHVEIKEDTGG